MLLSRAFISQPVLVHGGHHFPSVSCVQNTIRKMILRSQYLKVRSNRYGTFHLISKGGLKIPPWPPQWLTCQLPMGVGHCPWGGYTDQNVCDMHVDVNLASASACDFSQIWRKSDQRFYFFKAMKDGKFLRKYYTRQLAIGAGHCPWGGCTDQIVCNIHGEVLLTSRYIPKMKLLGPTVLALQASTN